jgi:ribosomal protein S12 methylthiotransferase accessory factor
VTPNHLSTFGIDSDWTINVDRLVSGLGVVGEVSANSIRGLPELSVYSAANGSAVPGRVSDHSVFGTGRALGNPRLARAIAVAEAAERYAGGEFFDEAPLRRRSGELPGREIDLAAVPRCSADEYADPACPVIAPDWRAEMRWIEGRELYSGERIWLPTTMACYGLARLPSERFGYPISTGYAVHSDMPNALFAAISEVVERDAIAVTWLQRLPLPRLPSSVLDEEAALLTTWLRRHFVEPHLFDATTDVGLPTVYVVLRAEHDALTATTVSCATGLTIRQAARKAILEAIPSRMAVKRESKAPPKSYAEFSGIGDGMHYMAGREMQYAFDFLTEQPEGEPGRAQTPQFAPNETEALKRLVSILGRLGMEMVAVDRTTRELAAVGLVAVTVVIPALQPMSLHPLAQFRAHPRLYSAPVRMGYRVLPEEKLNRLPQPFA